MADTAFDKIIVKIWKGVNASDLVYAQDVTGNVVKGQWNLIVLNNSVPINVSDVLSLNFVYYTITFDLLQK